MQLWDYYQVCTFKSSARAIRHGSAIRLSGRVPGDGYVTIYATRHKVSGQPATLAARGWVKLGRYRANSSGKFVSSLLHPTRTKPGPANEQSITEAGIGGAGADLFSRPHPT
jgi:hypothetical protein